MKKLLTLFGVLSFLQVAALNVVACTDPTSNSDNKPKPDANKPVLTQEIFDEFFNNDPTVNYTGAYVFNDGDEIGDWLTVSGTFLSKLAVATLYKDFSDKYTNNDFAFVTGSFNDGSIIFKTNEMVTIKTSTPFRTTSQKDEEMNRRLSFTFNFKQTNNMTGVELLEEIFNSYFTLYFFRNNPTEINTSRNKYEEYYTAWGGPTYSVFSESELESYSNQISKINYLANAYFERMNEDRKTNSLLQDIDVKILDLHDHKVVDSIKYYKIKAKLFLKSNPEIFIEKEFIDRGYE
ncbi:hypothetical protein SCLARK_00556 [Spiroplasma clarkii]|uniref:Lipoprotein n=1 Tax=Spiroplasma clarkii TaxID=2139 RepID=A0A1Y0L0J8_9MOLU|nr:hypothetical protein [Spiroplasma clarkii]ARU91238.1 hypothetical protein SCLARK_00556 [Spiroplasma clarkii]ATX70677.1 hypothetical protein SCLAR_v1c03470 [Spiroplasma clarkii]